MLSLNIQNDVILFRDVQLEYLPQILEWYNKIDEYKFATGIDKPITLEKLTQKYSEVAICSNEFFVGIYTKARGDLIGILKGSIRHENKRYSVWISSIVIDTQYQDQGYGSEAVNLLLSHVKAARGIRNAYVAVIENNPRGMAFWLKHGFKELKRIPNHIRLDNQDQNVIIMRKRI
ncbi:MAG: GNAT family N-acetyltransferase [Clostridiales bacterium]|jgi:RimJ/RimL family protein N-acetyltransferase|nr:GNAT family N-acetyltransferase [Eubacteriales bacterium]MDH7566660.1 GNAT family N-acetyltransferase [Clostridiales bacterium]